MSKQILILGAGYGGLLSALSAREHFSAEEAAITVINRYDSHQIITELHRLAAGNVAEKAVTLPLEKLFKGKDIHVKIGTVAEIDPEAEESFWMTASRTVMMRWCSRWAAKRIFSAFPDCGKIA